MILHKTLNRILYLTVILALLACSGTASNKDKNVAEAAVSSDGHVVESTSDSAVAVSLPYSGDELGKYGTEETCEAIDESAVFANLQYSHP